MKEKKLNREIVRKLNTAMANQSRSDLNNNPQNSNPKMVTLNKTKSTTFDAKNIPNKSNFMSSANRQSDE